MRVVLQSERASHWRVMGATPFFVLILKVTLLAQDGSCCLVLLRTNMSLHRSRVYQLQSLEIIWREVLRGHFLDAPISLSESVLVCASGISCLLRSTSVCFHERFNCVERFLHIFGSGSFLQHLLLVLGHFSKPIRKATLISVVRFLRRRVAPFLFVSLNRAHRARVRSERCISICISTLRCCMGGLPGRLPAELPSRTARSVGRAAFPHRTRLKTVCG